MKIKKYVKSFEEKSLELKLSDVNNSNVLVTIKDLLKKGDVNTIARIMTDYNSKVTSEFFKEADKLIADSIHGEAIDTLIRGMLGIFS